jgi:hypothetical protein
VLRSDLRVRVMGFADRPMGSRPGAIARATPDDPFPNPTEAALLLNNTAHRSLVFRVIHVKSKYVEI